jgi:hypothetical protein
MKRKALQACLPIMRKLRESDCWMTSKDGVEWSAWRDLSLLGQGQYQSSGNQEKQLFLI